MRVEGTPRSLSVWECHLWEGKRQAPSRASKTTTVLKLVPST
jgi:hypothetical protein